MNNYVFDYNANDLKTSIYGTTSGNTITPVLVDTNGAVVVTGSLNNVIAGHSTASSNSTVSGTTVAYNIWPEPSGLDISQDTLVTFAGEPLLADANLKIQVSPDGNTWSDDITPAVTATSGQLATLATKTYMKYAALAYESITTAGSINVWYQTQV
jgi:hypothetical protein